MVLFPADAPEDAVERTPVGGPGVPFRHRRPRWWPGVALTVLLAALGAACGPTGEPDLSVGGARAAQPVSGSSQIVLTIVNDGDGDDRLVEATTDAALGVEIHRTLVEEGRATMAEEEAVAIPAGEAVRFRPGGLHLMMVVPDETVVRGGTFSLTLRFDRSDELTVPVEVVGFDELLDEPTANGDASSDSPGEVGEVGEVGDPARWARP